MALLFRSRVRRNDKRLGLGLLRSLAAFAADRHAAVFQFEVPAASFKPEFSTCQVSIIDAWPAGFAFLRLQMYVR
jgi:hypothetical protein